MNDHEELILPPSQEEILKRIRDFLTSEGYDAVFFDNKQNRFFVPLTGDTFVGSLLLSVFVVGNDVVYMECHSSFRCGKEARINALAFISLVNEGYMYGRFELNSKNDELVFASYIDCSAAVPPNSVLRNAIRGSVDAFEIYASAIIATFYYGGDPIFEAERAEKEYFLRQVKS